jgi:diguanylate cyclase (GGDEF)-like protein
MVDADHFKEYNDKLGHQAGDECLRLIASKLSELVTRPGDIVARFGGEEFVILLPNTPLEGARHLAETLRVAVFNLAIAHPGAPRLGSADVATECCRVTVSIGCAAIVPAVGSHYRQLVEMADRGLYVAKREGRNRVCVLDGEPTVWRRGMAASKLRARLEAFGRR